ncbi:hypothetical protein EJ05DRAFT_512372 [Pseudovirgaria hyperparasitica]|uniref:Nucleolar protein 12 n=1 Tax=Pseudovirgaria hyperparasitica TaxID=470096 RepID=A0A6A6W1G5_9PEZI|nr:uncharacterized protein EJ05DRAFT_512372 [Pseudovirgaria hyperparasitica]KAF2756752.1 hypothetical protein EJ05DRAFT_512372 [Pseudovirgaria hyperparasitica]
MGKSKSLKGGSRTDSSPAAKSSKEHRTSAFAVDQKAVDPALASLFSASLGPVQPLPKSRYHAAEKVSTKATKDAENDEELSELSSDTEAPDATDSEGGVAVDGDEVLEDSSEETSDEGENTKSTPMQLHDIVDTKSEKSTRKRKRKENEDDLEDVYLQKLAEEEQKEEAKLRQEKRPKRDQRTGDPSMETDGNGDDDAPEDDADTFVPPQHESLAAVPKTPDELDKASRTVFLGNVSTAAITSKTAKKTLLAHLSSFLSTLPPSTPPHKVESLRFRSTAFSTPLPKKAAFAKKDLMAETTKSTHAYVVYSTVKAASAAAPKLNGTVVLDRHIRVDHVSHPQQIDHRRCVFIGNLGFVDDETALRAAAAASSDGKPRKPKPAADVEEGLWKHLASAGTIESVRVVRDAKTRVGKGFAYVQFADQNGVEKALLLDGKAFPPMLPRSLRVTRAKSMKRNPKDASHPAVNRRAQAAPGTGKGKGMYNPKMSQAEKSALGRTGKLLGRAGAAAARSGKFGGAEGVARTPESFVFEGHRATASQGKTGFKFKGSGNNKGGKKAAGAGGKTRRTHRAAEWKKNGGKKD